MTDRTASTVIICFAVIGLSFGCTAAESGTPADLIAYNGHIVTLDPQSSEAQAVAVRDGRIVAVGTDAEVLALAGPDTEQIDLAGQTVVPGLGDNHFHGIGGGAGVDLSEARSLGDVHGAITARAAQTPAGEIIRTNSDWHEGQLAEQRLPYRDDLDRAAPGHPVGVVRGGHEYVLNSAALALWNITEATPDPEGGVIGRYDDGRLNGELVDRAKGLARLPRGSGDRPDYEERLTALADEHRILNEAGLTSVRYGSGSVDRYRMLEDLKDRGLLTIRASVLLRLGGSTDPETLADTFSEWGIGPDAGDEWVRVAGIKLGVDGGFEGGWMREPYEEPWGKRGTFAGLQTFPSAPYVALVRALNTHGWRVATHAVGDAAIDLVLDAYEAAHQDSAITGKRWAIEHGFVPQEDQFPRMAAMGLHISAQNHLYVAAPSLRNYWGAARADWVTPVRAYIDAGLDVSLGTDAPVIPYRPMWVLYHFITRDTISAGIAGPDQRLGREEALRLSSLGNARLTFEENVKGSIEEGKLADMIVLSDDILTCAEEQIDDIQVMMTIVGGKVVYRTN